MSRTQEKLDRLATELGEAGIDVAGFAADVTDRPSLAAAFARIKDRFGGDATLFPAFADFTFTVLDQVAECDKVATRWTMGGTHTGEFFGLPASGKTAFLTGTSVDRVENGQIVEHWSDMDLTGFLQQLGNPLPSAVEVAHQLADE
ncbi:ester cyclase [Actinomycetes bacterium KLBMP 9797]